jgi:uncharacterized protein
MQREIITTEEELAMNVAIRSATDRNRKKIWVDLENSPHVPLFCPIIEELRDRGYQVLLTARNSYQVCDLLNLHNLDCEVVGRHWGKNRLLKILGMIVRVGRLLPRALRYKPDLALSHGSRSQVLTAYLLRIPTLVMYDYEFTNNRLYAYSTWHMTPQYVASVKDVEATTRMLKYPGLKEDVYVPRFCPNSNLRAQLGIAPNDLMITIRPPATEAHYHNPESELLFDAAMNFFLERPETRIVLLPRNARQAASLGKNWERDIADTKIVIPEKAIDGLNLIWFSDLVVSGGGTMNREAAALGVPVYSIFRGQIGAVDQYLAQQGRLTLIESAQDVRTKIVLVRRDRPEMPPIGDRPALQVIVNNIVSVMARRPAQALG